MSTQTLRLVIHGRVQGVWFRESMKQQAERLGIRGWVMNRADGCVEAVIQGNDPAVAAMLAWAQFRPAAGQGNAGGTDRSGRRIHGLPETLDNVAPNSLPNRQKNARLFLEPG